MILFNTYNNFVMSLFVVFDFAKV